MAHQGYFTLGDTEIANESRTVQLARAMGIGIVRTRPAQVQWIEDALLPAPGEYGEIVSAPWYDPYTPASMEFAGLLPLKVEGLDDSNREATVTEYVGDGGNVGRTRNASKPLVWSGVLIGSTERGVEYGLKWLHHTLANVDVPDSRFACVGPSLTYFSHARRTGDTEYPSLMHRNKVKLTRGISVTRRKSSRNGSMATVTFTMVAADPHEYAEPLPQVIDLGDLVGVSGPGIVDQGSEVLEQATCPAYDYTPVYDPLYPALVAPPAPPNLLPSGWGVTAERPFLRSWVQVEQVSPDALSLVPVVTIRNDSIEARTVRVSIINVTDTDTTDDRTGMCNYLWAAVVSYLPVGADFIIDGENKVAYVWDGANSRLSDSLVYADDATPVDWTSFNGLGSLPESGFILAVDTFEKPDEPGEYEGDGDTRVSVSFVPKSD